ncbi:MAG: thioredoxin-disulfide reductase [Candidatus Omnitrophica bacterium]|nr:thioredoxin-disulfide reductase [Candidatus Omnitrophota bacterium]
MADIHEIVILGGGPAGLTAGLYAARARMDVILFEKAMPGGQILVTDRIENFPGFPEGVSGPDLAEWMTKQAAHFGLKTVMAEAKSIEPKKKQSGYFLVKLEDGSQIKTLSLIAATGAGWNRLGIPGEVELIGRGVSYCATCDGPLFRSKEVVVVGGGDTALEDGLFLAKFASKVTIVHRRDRLRATKILQERAEANPKIEMCLDSVATGIAGNSRVEAIKVKNLKTGVAKDIRCDGVFIFIGITPSSDIFKPIVKTDDKGYIIADDDMKTSCEGIFVCGDVRKKALRQVVTATGDGATAAVSAQNYVERLKGIEYK